MTRDTGYWADNYQRNKLSVEKAIAKINSGQRIFIGSSCGEPQRLVKGLADASLNYTDLEIVRMFSGETTSLSRIAEKSKSQNVNIRSFYLGSANSKSFKGDLRFITPINLSAVHKLIKSRLMPIQVALIQVTPPDDFGWMSLGISVDVTASAAAAADLVIAQVNRRMPRVLGRSYIHVNDIDYFVEHDEELIEIGTLSRCGHRRQDRPVCLPAGGGRLDHADVARLDLRGQYRGPDGKERPGHPYPVHDQHHHETGGHGGGDQPKKGFNTGKIICSNAIGNRELYDLLDNNPAVEFHPSKYVNDPRKIAKNNRMVAMNICREIDLDRPGGGRRPAFQLIFPG